MHPVIVRNVFPQLFVRLQSLTEVDELMLKTSSHGEATLMKKVFRVFCVAVFAAGLLSFSLAQKRTIESDEIEPARPFKATYVQSQISADGAVKIIGHRTRYVKADGEWRIVVHGPEGPDASLDDFQTESPVYASLPDGVYGKAAGANQRQSFSPQIDEQVKESEKQLERAFRSHRSLKNQPLFVRTEEVAGLKVYIMRSEINDPANPQIWEEKSFSPQTGLTPLRTVVHFRDGSEIRIEATKVEFKDVPEDMNDDLKAMPVKKENKP